ncbi:unnamed protein product [Sphagnum balticum]
MLDGRMKQGAMECDGTRQALLTCTHVTIVDDKYRMSVTVGQKDSTIIRCGHNRRCIGKAISSRARVSYSLCTAPSSSAAAFSDSGNGCSPIGRSGCTVGKSA